MEAVSLKWLLISVICALAICVTTGCQISELQTEHHYYVHPDGENSSCPTDTTCRSLSFYVDNKEDYFKSNTTFHFLEGSFSHSSNFLVEDITDLRMVDEMRNSTIDCSASDNAGFAFINVSRLQIEGLKLYNCGQTLNFGQHGDVHTALGCNNGSNHSLFDVVISHSRSQNIYYSDFEGHLTICHCTFAHAANATVEHYYYGGNAFFFNNCNSQPTINFLIENSWFLNNTNKQERSKSHYDLLNFASGLVIVLKCSNLNVTIDNVVLDQNQGLSGGNMAIVFHDISHLFVSPVHIKNSHITNGRAEVGGGVFVTLVEASQQINQVCNHTNPRPLLLITNTTFSGNEAKKGGGGLYLRPKESQTYCSIGKIIIRMCTFTDNTMTLKGPGAAAIHITNYLALAYLQHATPQYHVEIIDTEFCENYVKSPSGKGVIFVKASPHVGLTNVSIHDNNCSGILGVSSSFVISGNVEIFNNTASSGGGILFCSDSVMFLTPNTNLDITNNSVEHAGGGICIEMLCLQSRPMCFFQLDNETLMNHTLMDTIHVNLENNTAVYAGDGVYGGSIEFCFMLDPPLHKGQADKSKYVFKHIFHIEPTLPSSNASPPQRVCVCNLSNKTQRCFKPEEQYVYPGEMFQLPLVIVGQYNGTVPGTIEAKLEQRKQGYEYYLGNHDNHQGLYKTCRNVSYTVLTNAEHATLALRVEIVGDASFVEHLREYRALYVDVRLKECPIGFELQQMSAENRYCCQCISAFSNRSIECDIKSQTIIISKAQRPVWIGYNSKTKMYFISKSLAFDYLSPNDRINISVYNNLMDQDAQCHNNRTGILCGACHENYSVILGSSECQSDCTNNYLSLVIAFAIAGIVLIFLLTFLNLTVAEGTLNGLIFYANIVQIHQAIFFQYYPIRILTTSLLLFISWINLDLGIPVCFYEGMDEYAKAWLQFLFPVYVWMLAGILILLSRKSNSFAKLFGRNGVKVLATLILLSYTKMLRAIISTMHSQVITHYDASGNDSALEEKIIHWKPDANLLYLQGKHIPLFIMGLFFGLICLPFTFVLLCIQNLQKVSNRRCFTWVARLKPFFDTFTGPYSKPARFWTGLLLLTRCVLYTSSALNYYGIEVANVYLTIIACTILFVIAWILRPGIYEKRSLDILECSFLLNLCLLCTCTAFTVYDDHKHSDSQIAHLSVLVAFVTFIGIVLYHGYKQIVCYMRAMKSRSHSTVIIERPGVSTTEVTTSTASPLENPLTKFPPFVRFDQDREPLLAPDDEEEQDATGSAN